MVHNIEVLATSALRHLGEFGSRGAKGFGYYENTLHMVRMFLGYPHKFSERGLTFLNTSGSQYYLVGDDFFKYIIVYDKNGFYAGKDVKSVLANDLDMLDVIDIDIVLLTDGVTISMYTYYGKKVNRVVGGRFDLSEVGGKGEYLSLSKTRQHKLDKFLSITHYKTAKTTANRKRKTVLISRLEKDIESGNIGVNDIVYCTLREILFTDSDPRLKHQLRSNGVVNALATTEGLLRFATSVNLYLRNNFYDVAPNTAYLERLSQGVCVKLTDKERIALYERYRALHGHSGL